MQSVSAFLGKMFFLMMLLSCSALSTTTLSDKIEEKASDTLKDNANVDANVCLSISLHIFQTNFLLHFSTTVCGQWLANWKTRHLCCRPCQFKDDSFHQWFKWRIGRCFGMHCASWWKQRWHLQNNQSACQNAKWCQQCWRHLCLCWFIWQQIGDDEQ